MAEHLSSARKKRRKGAGRGMESTEVFHLPVTAAAEAALRGNQNAVDDIQNQSGATLHLDPDLSQVQGKKIIVIRGYRSQIDMAVSLINKETGTQETISEQAQSYWLQWVQDTFPDLDSSPYFLPPVFFKRVPTSTESKAGQVVHVIREPAGVPGSLGAPPHPVKVQDGQVRDDDAMQRLLFCLEELALKNKEVQVGLSNFQFGDYLGEPCYAAAAALLPTWPKNWARGDFDLVLIHRHYGCLVVEVKALGDNVEQLNLSQQKVDDNIRKKLEVATSQLNKAEETLSHLISDVAPGVRIQKAIAFPNLTARQLDGALSGYLHTKELRECLGATDSAEIPGLCICSDQLSDPTTPRAVSDDVLNKLGAWWQRRVSGSGADSHMTSDVYRTLVARFCGPATTVTVPCTFPPRRCVRTIGQAVSLTGECYTAQIMLFPEQVDLINSAPPRVVLAGPPGTGKSVVLLLMATEWLRDSNDVYVISTCDSSRAACIMLHHLLRQILTTLQTAEVAVGHPTLLLHDLASHGKMEDTLNNLSRAASAKDGRLYVIADEAGPNVIIFEAFCDKLATLVPALHLWAASCYHGHAPASWRQDYFTRPLRSPPAVVREVEGHWRKTRDPHVDVYSTHEHEDHTDGPVVAWVSHQGGDHSDSLKDCYRCGREVARILTHSLRVGVSAGSDQGSDTRAPTVAPPPSLQYRDVLVLYNGDGGERAGPAMVAGLRSTDMPVLAMMDADVQDVATARSDVVWLADGERVRGLERKVVVCLGDDDCSLHILSRCTSQLVVVSRWHKPKPKNPSLPGGAI